MVAPNPPACNFGQAAIDRPLRDCRDPFATMRLIATTGRRPAEQSAPIGCPIKWRTT